MIATSARRLGHRVESLYPLLGRNKSGKKRIAKGLPVGRGTPPANQAPRAQFSEKRTETYNRGNTTTAKGYVRVTAGPNRHRYEHRVVMAVSLRIGCPAWLLPLLNGDGLPEGFHVHHIDGRRAHNCPQNLMLLEAVIHDHLSLERARAAKLARDLELIRALDS